ncbi:hypothetical protein RJ55_02090 [Drechmeria coniospora]|nr:hypothetical protein RJ55_02090 [Drechmeria coniospora]
MAAVTRQPFAPLHGARLHNLTSLKNRQNVLPSAGKRKADLLDADDGENLDPLLFAKRAKGGASSATPPRDGVTKPLASVLAKPAVTPAADRGPLANPLRPSSTPRRTLQAKSPSARLGAGIAKSSPVPAPAGRSPGRGGRSGILSSRRRAYSRVDPPAFRLATAAAAAPFSLDDALKGTLSSYRARPRARADVAAPPSWFFDIHEDTPEQEMTNLLQHGTCVLDISADERGRGGAGRDADEGRDKENTPPSGEPPRAEARRGHGPAVDDTMMAVDKKRVALGEMTTADFYADGCDETSVVLVPADDDEPSPAPAPAPRADEGEPVVADGPSEAAVLRPVDGTGESFELWESGSVHDEAPAASTEP